MSKYCGLCISSQVGCKQGCVFCAAGKMGEMRNLTTHEILARVWLGRRQCRSLGWPRVHNLVFMGMGESTNNMKDVREALGCLMMSTVFVFHVSSSLYPRWWLLPRSKFSHWRICLASGLGPLMQATTSFVGSLSRVRSTQHANCETYLSNVWRDVPPATGVNTAPEHSHGLTELLTPFDRDDILINLFP